MRRRRQRAQGLIEFALMAPMFLMIVTMVFDFARAAWVYSSLASVVREGGRQAILAQYGTSNPTDATITSHMLAWAPQLALSVPPSPANCIHGWASPPVLRKPPTANTGWIYVIAGSPTSTVNAPSGGEGTLPAPGAGCVSTVSAGYSTTALEVEVVYNFQPITPFASQFFGSGIAMQVSTTMNTEF